jgi:hypothetical protein
MCNLDAFLSTETPPRQILKAVTSNITGKVLVPSKTQNAEHTPQTLETIMEYNNQNGHENVFNNINFSFFI